jgi:hypothetical protein
MPDRDNSPASVNADQFRVLLREAGLTVSEERAPMVLEELNAQLGFAHLFPPAPDDVSEHDLAQFDPAFPTIGQKDTAE